MPKKTEDSKGPFLDRMAKMAKQKTVPAKVSPHKFNEAIAETALNRMDYPKPKRMTISPVAQAAAECALDRMDCPLLQVRGWDCNKTEKGKELSHPYFEQGEEPQCKNGGFLKCPAYNRYFSWRIKHQAKQRDKAETTE